MVFAKDGDTQCQNVRQWRCFIFVLSALCASIVVVCAFERQVFILSRWTTLLRNVRTDNLNIPFIRTSDFTPTSILLSIIPCSFASSPPDTFPHKIDSTWYLLSFHRGSYLEY